MSAHKLDQAMAVPIGMNEVQVANMVGEPKIKDKDKDGSERWIWSREGQFGLESVTLVMKDGRVAAIETVGERLKHLEELARLKRTEELLDEKTEELLTRPRAQEKEPLPLKTEASGAPARILPDDQRPIIKSTTTNALPSVALEQPLIPHEKSSEEIWREQEEALAVARREARDIEERTRTLVEKARAASAALERERASGPPLEVPPLTAWYIARQHVSDELAEQFAPKRTLFPNPRFVDSAGEERIEGNVWRTWGYVDTVDSSNTRKRLHWIAELEFRGGTKWDLRRDIEFREK